MNLKILALFILPAMICSTGCKKKNVCEQFKDKRDKAIYNVIEIGSKCWMAQNLNYDTGADNYCYDGNTANCDTYGKLYTQEVASTACPDGWHLPSRAEWLELINQNKGLDSAGLILIAGGSSGFEAKFAGLREHPSETFKFLDTKAHFWSSTAGTAGFYWMFEFTKGFGLIANPEMKKENALSCRCVKDLE